MIKNKTSGFTLIELSLALVIIGLVVGGLLFGRDMIRAAQLRSLISQVDQFKLATNIFKQKYGALPGDMSPTKAAQFGFSAFTGGYAGTQYNLIGFGDNNGLVSRLHQKYCVAECTVFWRHLSDAGLIDGDYGQNIDPDTDYNDSLGGDYAGVIAGENGDSPISSSLYMPATKGGFGFFGATSLNHMWNQWNFSDANLFYAVPAADAAYVSWDQQSFSAIDSYGIDAKLDDGKPNSGKVLAQTYDTFAGYFWSDGINDHEGNPLSPTSKTCTIGGIDANDVDARYNANPATGSNNISCIPLFLW